MFFTSRYKMMPYFTQFDLNLRHPSTGIAKSKIKGFR